MAGILLKKLNGRQRIVYQPSSKGCKVCAAPLCPVPQQKSFVSHAMRQTHRPESRLLAARQRTGLARRLPSHSASQPRLAIVVDPSQSYPARELQKSFIGFGQ